MIKFQGIYPPIATPFSHNGELYKAKVQHNVEKLNMVNLSLDMFQMERGMATGHYTSAPYFQSIQSEVNLRCLSRLRQRFDDRLVSLQAADAGKRLRALTQSPARLNGKVRAGKHF